MPKIKVMRHGLEVEIDNSIYYLQNGDILLCKIYTPRSYKIKKIKVISICRDMVFVELIESDKILENYKDIYFRKKKGDTFLVKPKQLISYYFEP